MQDYLKPPLTYAQQVDLLKSRGLTVSSDDDAVKFMEQVNYYRFSAYCLPFQNPRDVYIPGATFETIRNLYHLDEELRIAVLRLLSPIEIFLRTRIVYQLSHQKGAFAHYDPVLFWRRDRHREWLDSLEDEVERGKETFLDHYRARYTGFPRLPLWMACEIMSLGCLSLLYGNLALEYQAAISSLFEVRPKVFTTWLHVITYLRNTCAHQGRLWNRGMSIRPLMPERDTRWASPGLNNEFLLACVTVIEWVCRKAQIPLNNIGYVYEIMSHIAALDPRFAGMMGVPAGRPIGMCWEGVI